MLFNPPPNWPPPPAGWTPPEGWQPDPTWGSPPAGWQLWVAEAAVETPLEAAAPVLLAEGHNGQLRLDEGSRTLTLSRDGAVAKLAAVGHDRATRVIPLDALSGVRLHPATRLVNGHISLGLGGPPAPTPSGGHANANPDTVLFRFSQRDVFGRLHERLQAVIEDNNRRGINPSETGVMPLAKKSEARTDARRTARLEKAVQAYGADGNRLDIAEAAARMSWTLGGKRELKKLHDHVFDDEKVSFIAQGTYAAHQGVVALTDQRLVFVFHGLVQVVVEDFPLRNITSVASKKGLGSGTLIVHVAGAASHISGVVNADLGYLIDHLRRLTSASPIASTPAAPVAPVAAPVVLDLADQLEKLAGLRDRGILTDEEFAEQKKRLLGH
jgi:hypothetical protein